MGRTVLQICRVLYNFSPEQRQNQPLLLISAKMPPPFRRNRKPQGITPGPRGRTRTPPANASNPSTNANRIDTYIARASGIATVGALLLGGFGYFYTVRPAFQNQKLQEDNAKLQLDNEAAEKKSSELRRQQEQLKKETMQMRLDIEGEKHALSIATTSATDAKAHENEARRLARQASLQMKTQYAELDKARASIVMTHYTNFLGYQIVNSNLTFMNGMMQSDGDGSSYIKLAASAWPVPLDLVNAAWNEARKSAVVPPEYFQRIRASIDKHATELSCPKPDFVSMANQYEEERKVVLASVEQKAKDEIERQRVAAEKQGARLVVKADDLSRLEASYRISVLFPVDGKYRDSVIAARSKCEKSILAFSDKIDADLEGKTSKE